MALQVLIKPEGEHLGGVNHGVHGMSDQTLVATCVSGLASSPGHSQLFNVARWEWLGDEAISGHGHGFHSLVTALTFVLSSGNYKLY